MSYNYRTPQEQNWIKIKSILNTAINAVKEQLYHHGLLQAPEAQIQAQTLPRLPRQISQ